MVLTQGEESSEIFDRACNVLSEYGSLQRNASVSRTFLEEHYEALAEGNAVSALGNI